VLTSERFNFLLFLLANSVTFLFLFAMIVNSFIYNSYRLFGRGGGPIGIGESGDIICFSQCQLVLAICKLLAVSICKWRSYCVRLLLFF
jgi:hypothetical protein